MADNLKKQVARTKVIRCYCAPPRLRANDAASDPTSSEKRVFEDVLRNLRCFSASSVTYIEKFQLMR